MHSDVSHAAIFGVSVLWTKQLAAFRLESELEHELDVFIDRGIHHGV
jgi:hypothetical protein